MIENKSLGSKIFDVLNVVFLVIVMLICIMPAHRVERGLLYLKYSFL